MKDPVLTQLLKDALDDLEHEYRSYSGRGMYGDVCLSVTTDSPFDLLVEVAAYLGIELGERHQDESRDEEAQYTADQIIEVLSVLKRTRQDDMGRSTILYWPTLPWIEAKAEGSSES